MVNTEIRLIIFLAAKIEKPSESVKTRPGADCGSDYQLLIAQLRLKLKNTGKITRPFKYDLNQISYHYTSRDDRQILGMGSGGHSA